MGDAAQLISLTEGPDEVTADASLVVLDFLLRQGAVDPATPAYNGANSNPSWLIFRQLTVDNCRTW